MNNDFALMRTSKGGYVIGHGPFTELEECPGEGVAFYVNDFALKNEKPWKVPTTVERLVDLPFCSNDFEVSWETVELEPFARVFAEVSASILKGEIQKSVPCVSERGKLLSGDIHQLIFSRQRNPILQGYAWSCGGNGFCGLTPEVLFSHERGEIKTMALAGTASLAEKNVFSVDEKEIREHEFVAQTLISKLSEIGMVRVERRQIMELATLVHFHTPIQVSLYDGMALKDLIRRLHPTPALGPLPRTQKSMEDLVGWRNQVNCPEHFGAPMGIYDEGEFHSVVCIRGVHWQGGELSLPAGCGIIEASRLTNEWRELELKRQSVKELFRL